jgi:hypothetical protein
MRSSHPSPRASGLTVGEVPRGVLEALRACPRRKIIAKARVTGKENYRSSLRSPRAGLLAQLVELGMRLSSGRRFQGQSAASNR